MKSNFEPTTVQHSDDGLQVTRPPLARLAAILRQLEPAVAGAMAVAAGWLAATSQGDLPVLWLFCSFAALVGCWAARRRHATQAEIAVRAIALLSGIYALHTWGGGAGAMFLSWLCLGALYYVIVLKSLSRPHATAADKQRTDRSTALFNCSGFLAHGKSLLASCRADGRELTLAVFDCSDLLEARAVYGNRTSRRLVDSIVGKLASLAGNQGLAARTGPTQFAVAMPMPREKAVQAIERALGNPARFELERSRTEIVLVPYVMVEAIPSAGSVERMFSAMCRGLARVQEKEQLRQRHLEREHKRHSRPMSIPPILADEPPPRPRAPRLDPDPVIAHQIPNTIPMPLTTR